VVRDSLVSDIKGLTERETVAYRTVTSQPSARDSYKDKLTARYHVMFSPGQDEPERDVLPNHDRAGDWVSGGTRLTYHTCTTELSGDSLLVLIFSASESTFVHVVDVSPKGTAPKLPAYPGVRIPWGGRGPNFLGASITGSVSDDTFEVVLTLRPVADTPESRLKRGGGPPPSSEVVRYGLRKANDGLIWVRLDAHGTNAKGISTGR
jgi:hypothetical protein